MDKHRSIIDSFVLKAIAIIAMACNHTGHAFFDQLPAIASCILIAVGGLTFPIMAYLLVVGYQHTRNVQRYALRLGIFALISTLPFIWVLDDKLNVLFTLLMGLGIIWVDDHVENRTVFWLLFIAAIIASHWCDWSYIGVPMILLYHRGRNYKWQVVLPITLVWMIGVSYTIGSLTLDIWEQYWMYYLPTILYCFVGGTATIPLLYYYNGERGRSLKYFFYAFYPAHIVLLGLVKGIAYGIWW
ncbi:MAG: conjugal transfer protein TraX [Coriobacteriales bacterium]|jgi:hypothetical protein|nr:conjugal transfer protein TraX [Coriobacteriales bacterium]